MPAWSGYFGFGFLPASRSGGRERALQSTGLHHGHVSPKPVLLELAGIAGEAGVPGAAGTPDVVSTGGAGAWTAELVLEPGVLPHPNATTVPTMTRERTVESILLQA